TKAAMYAPLTDITSIERKKTLPLIRCGRLPLVRSMAAAPDRNAMTPALICGRRNTELFIGTTPRGSFRTTPHTSSGQRCPAPCTVSARSARPAPHLFARDRRKPAHADTTRAWQAATDIERNSET